MKSQVCFKDCAPGIALLTRLCSSPGNTMQSPDSLEWQFDSQLLTVNCHLQRRTYEFSRIPLLSNGEGGRDVLSPVIHLCWVQVWIAPFEHGFYNAVCALLWSTTQTKLIFLPTVDSFFFFFFTSCNKDKLLCLHWETNTQIKSLTALVTNKIVIFCYCK